MTVKATDRAIPREGSNFAWLLAERLTRLAVGFLTGILVARYLGPDRFGRLSYALSLLALVGSLLPLGLNRVAKREILSTPHRVHSILATVVGMRLAALTLTVMVGAIVLMAYPLDDRLLLVSAAGVMIVPFVTSFDLVLESRLEGRVTFFAKLTPTLVSAALRLLLLALGAPLEAFAVAVSIESVLLAISLALTMRRLGVKYPPKLYEPQMARRLFSESWPLILSGLAVVIYGRIDLVMLRHFTGEVTVGYYAAAVRLSELSYMLPVLLASTLFPSLIEAQKQHVDLFRSKVQRLFDLNAFIAYLSAAILCFGAPWWIGIAYGAEFAPAGAILSVHAWSAVFVYLGVARGHILTAERKAVIQLVSTGVGALINIVLNALLIPRTGAIGAAWATIAAQAAAAWLVLGLSTESRWIFRQITVSVLLPFTGLRYLRTVFTRRVGDL